jgi:FMN-dependent NADH-azoreductase
MKLLHVDTSVRFERSASRSLSRYFVDQLTERVPAVEVRHLDLAKETPAHVNELFTQAAYTPPGERTPEMDACLWASDALCDLLLESDAFVFSIPMYNFCYPSTFKAFLDNVVRGGKTYTHAEDGRLVGQLSRQKALFITTRGTDMRPGGTFADYDALTPALRAAFGFMGVQNPQFVDAQPVQFAGVEAREMALARARKDLDRIVADWQTRD